MKQARVFKFGIISRLVLSASTEQCTKEKSQGNTRSIQNHHMPNDVVENAPAHEGELIGKMITLGLTVFDIGGTVYQHPLSEDTVTQILDKKLPWYRDALKRTREILG